ncbi:MAG: hypothetical protein M1832_004763 [Thelocarpon impressellum]|nr:MAG: hypothetical protein M1832_004763 [Thelocarpon impressellum]
MEDGSAETHRGSSFSTAPSSSNSPGDGGGSSFSGTSGSTSNLLASDRQGFMSSPDSLDAFASVAIADQDAAVHSRASRDLSRNDTSPTASIRVQPVSSVERPISPRGEEGKHHIRWANGSERGIISGQGYAMTTGRPSSLAGDHLRGVTAANSYGSAANNLPDPSNQTGLAPGGPVRDHDGHEEAGPQCSYTENCTTNSPLRKVVSHIFGRNKLCTRQIPKGVWVHYCRKHYQRSRYRNPKGFALLQCDLVRKQVDRLRLWGGVLDWMVKVRKREEARLSKAQAEQASRPDGSDEDSDENAGKEDVSAAGPSSWLMQCVGAGKTTEEVLEILSRIEAGIAATGSGFPDVEILPNVAPSASAVVGPSRRSSSAASRHRRTRSDTLRTVVSTASRPRAATDAERKRKTTASRRGEHAVTTMLRATSATKTSPSADNLAKRQRGEVSLQTEASLRAVSRTDFMVPKRYARPLTHGDTLAARDAHRRSH